MSSVRAAAVRHVRAYRKVQGALNEMYFKRARAMWDAGQYLDAGRGYMLYAMSDGVDDADKRDPALFLAARYASERGASPLTDDALKFATDMASAIKKSASPELKPFVDEVSTWACDNRGSFPACKACSDVTTDAEDGLPVAKKRAEAAKLACGQVLMLAPACSSEAGTEIMALPSGVATLEANIAAEQAPATLTYDNIDGNWDCRVVVWDFMTPVVASPYRLAQRLNMFGKVTNMGYGRACPARRPSGTPSSASRGCRRSGLRHR